MQIKKYLVGVITGALLVSMTYSIQQVDAIGFSKDEEKYMKICSSGQLTDSNKSTCESFNKYLKNKNKELASQLAKQKKTASDTKLTLDSVQKKLNSINNDIATKEKEIQYVETVIKNTQKEIDDNNQQIKDRMYVMQSYMNDNSIIDYIFSADSFTDLFTRIEGFNDLTFNDKQLISQMLENKKNIEKQKKTLDSAKKVLESQKAQQAVVQAQYSQLLEEQRKNIAATQNALYDYGSATASLSAAIDKFNEEAKKEDTTPPSNSKPVPPASNNSGNNNSNNNPNNNNDSTNNNDNSNNNNNGSTNNSNNSNNNNNDSSNISSDELGYKIYQIAYSKLGCRYYWGASGPDYFDCSGLVYYCLKNAGVNTYRTTAAEYSKKWTAVSWGNSKTGDLVCFGSPAYHIGIVILNADGTRSVIHAGGGNSQTIGNNPNAKVKISSLQPGSYYYRNISTIRRVK